MNAAQQLAAMRKQHIHVCRVCKDKFIGIAQAKTCSNACRQKMKRLKADHARLLEMAALCGVRLGSG